VRGSVWRARKLEYMARISDLLLYSVFFLYPTEDDAWANRKAGGTGFRVSVPSTASPNHFHIYGISNRHVVIDQAAPVIRQNTGALVRGTVAVAGGDPIPLTVDQWEPHPDPAVDLAIAPLGMWFIIPRVPNLPYAIPSSSLMTHEVIDVFDIGVGDEVYMVGRYIHHSGNDFNKPTVRSGIISLMPDMIDVDDCVLPEEMYLVEMRSIGGYSGSPVFWQLPMIDMIAPSQRNMKPEAKKTMIGPWLMGIECMRHNFYDHVLRKVKQGSKTRYENSKYTVKSHIGQSLVIPAWKVHELLNLEKFDMARKHADKKLAKDLDRQKHKIAERTSSTPHESEFNRNTFENALRRASRKTPKSQSKDSEKAE
jgi:hypothetical protein